MKHLRRLAAGTGIAALALFGAGIPLGAQNGGGNGGTTPPDGGSGEEQVHLSAINESGATGEATVSTGDGEVDVTVQARGLSPDVPHAMHLHIGGEGVCPPPTAAGDDPLITTAEGQPSYGSVAISLTENGATAPGSALAVERMPTASAEGTLSYSRSIQIPDGVSADDISGAVLVVHGLATLEGDPEQYDGDQMSSLNDSLPLEATIPVLCAPVSDSAAGEGGTTSTTTRRGNRGSTRTTGGS